MAEQMAHVIGPFILGIMYLVAGLVGIYEGGNKVNITCGLLLFLFGIWVCVVCIQRIPMYF